MIPNKIIKLGILILSLLILINISFGSNFQMEWGKTTSHNETWITINLNVYFDNPIVVATPEYTTTTQPNGISTWVRNVTSTSFELKTSDENFASQDNVTVHYIVLEKGSWTLPNSTRKIIAGEVNTTKYGYQGNYPSCPSGGETIAFNPTFDSTPLVMSTRVTDSNPNVFADTIISATDSTATASSTGMCIRLSRSRSGTATFTNPETIHWIGIDEGNGTVGGSEYDVLWNLDDTGDSAGNWINGYGDTPPFAQGWAHTWTGAPNIIIGSQTSIQGGDGSWPVIYDTGNTGSIRMFVEESNERSHGGSESGGGWAFNHSSYVQAPANVSFKLSDLFIGWGVINQSNITKNTYVDSYKWNDNVSVVCDRGDCGVIRSNWSVYDMVHNEEKELEFMCLNTSIGSKWAIFNVTSLNDTSVNQINVSCTYYQIYGYLSPSLNDPPSAVITPVAQNRTFVIEATVECVGPVNTTCGNVTGYAVYNGSANVLGDGSDGSLTVNVANTVVNIYTYLTGNENIGDDTITVNSAAGFSVGDEILIIQMQNGSGTGDAGNYQFAIIDSISTNDITIVGNLSFTFGSGTFNALSSSATQVIRVPQYSDVNINSGASITASAWNGQTGGIVVFRASGNLNTTGYINVSDKGYRGGDCNGCGNNAWGDQGEGYTGIGSGVLTANNCGGGGGYGPSGYNGEPGAGGGHATVGGDGVSSFTAIGGGTVGTPDLSRIFFGGGAGGGGDNDNVAPFPEYTSGGGIVMVFVKEMLNARIVANGEDGQQPGGMAGTSGGGAGGSIWLSAEALTITSVDASGGIGGMDTDDTSGDGGNGRIRLDFTTSSGAPTLPSGYNDTFGGSSNMIPISNVTGSSPLFVVSDVNPKNCFELNNSQTCTLSWIVNATGPINTTLDVAVIFESSAIPVSDKQTLNATINITRNIVPLIKLYNPTNSSKVLGNGTVMFEWSINDDSWSNCSLYINGILNMSKNCSANINITHNLTLDRGYYTWYINTTDIDNNTAVSQIWSFYNIFESASRVNKSISSINSSQYLVRIIVTNLLSNTIIPTLIDFVDVDFNAGSFAPIWDWRNVTYSPYNGTIYGWDLEIGSYQINETNYSIVGLGLNYSLENNYMVGLE